ncbi:MAG: hypothetical protein QOE61_39, partial [Micromonosporaceae bacterium]|nr:hypothetical protein [Micromonosporaceae bacterium]
MQQAAPSRLKVVEFHLNWCRREETHICSTHAQCVGSYGRGYPLRCTAVERTRRPLTKQTSDGGLRDALVLGDASDASARDRRPRRDQPGLLSTVDVETLVRMTHRHFAIFR